MYASAKASNNNTNKAMSLNARNFKAVIAASNNNAQQEPSSVNKSGHITEQPKVTKLRPARGNNKKVGGEKKRQIVAPGDISDHNG